MPKIAAIVVTYNRKKLLFHALKHLLSQDIPLQQIIVIDNNSNDGTEEEITKYYSSNRKIAYIKLKNNTGGAGGFHEGVKYAYEKGYDWLWLMDDDAEPALNALENLIKLADDPLSIYGSAAIYGEQLCWPVSHQGQKITHCADLPEKMDVDGIPFLGFFINRELVDKIGFPDADFFISGDDMEYCQRAKKLGKKIMLVRDSHIYHPLPNRITLKIFGHQYFCLLLAPWRTYYDIRNRIVLAKRHYGIKLFTKTMPGVLLRWVITLLFEKNRWQQSIAYVKGIKDGLIGRLGKTW